RGNHEAARRADPQRPTADLEHAADMGLLVGTADQRAERDAHAGRKDGSAAGREPRDVDDHETRPLARGRELVVRAVRLRAGKLAATGLAVAEDAGLCVRVAQRLPDSVDNPAPAPRDDLPVELDSLLDH